jgi:methylated-DNA-[protein]-cysteine S-methyltransferase
MSEHTHTSFTIMPSPVGALTLVGEGDDLTGVYFETGSSVTTPRMGWVRDDRRFRPAVTQLSEYFAGKRTRFDLPIAPRGTAFQKAVWAALLRIPFGQTASYGDIARAIGKPAASRAVGGANHRNPLSIIIPCHRVIGTDGGMTGYGGELYRKRLLLDLESRFAAS